MNERTDVAGSAAGSFAGATTPRPIALAVAACLAGGAGLYAASRWPAFVARVDRPLSDALRRTGGALADDFTLVLSSRRFLVVLLCAIVIAVAAIDRAKLARVAATIAASGALFWLGNELTIKRGLAALDLARPRPWMASGSAAIGTTIFSDSSFPSSHMASLVAVLLALTLHMPRARAALACGWLAMAFARTHAGMHYPSDVVAGSLFGVAYALAGAHLVERWYARRAAAPTVAQTPPA